MHLSVGKELWWPGYYGMVIFFFFADFLPLEENSYFSEGRFLPTGCSSNLTIRRSLFSSLLVVKPNHTATDKLMMAVHPLLGLFGNIDNVGFLLQVLSDSDFYFHCCDYSIITSLLIYSSKLTDFNCRSL